jgi:thermitase
MIQSLTFLVTFISLGFWLITEDGSPNAKPLGKIALLSLISYALVIFLQPLGLIKTVSEIAIYIFGSLFVNTFSRSQLLASLLLLAISGGYYAVFQPFSNPENQNTSYLISNDNGKIVELDSQAEFLIRLKSGYNLEDLSAVFNQYGLSAQVAFSVQEGKNTDLDDFYAVNLPETKLRAATELLKIFKNHIAILEVEYNETVLLSPMQKAENLQVANDNLQINDAQINKVWAFSKMEMSKFYLELRLMRPTRKTRIAIIDTGVDAMHEDLMANFIRTSEYNDKDPHSHGTHCAGIAAAVTNNNVGIASFGINSDWVEIISVKVFDSKGRSSQQKIINGMIEAVDRGATVLSMSLGGPSSDEAQNLYKQAVAYANKKGAIVIVAAGNENMDASERVPASVAGVITVSALDSNLQKAVFSNEISKLKMGVAAGGVDIYSTIPNNSYEFFNGTSMATPYVAGLVAIMKAIRPDLNTQQVFDILDKTGKKTEQSAQTGHFIQPAAVLKALK